jgi:choice-of-anchor C domain-containing protein
MFPVALLLAASTPSAPVPKKVVELVTNGGFEDGPDVDRWLPVDKGSTDIKGWTVTRGQIDYIGPGHWASGEGKRSLDLHGSPGYGGVKQTIKTEKGKKYVVTFKMASTPGGSPLEKSLWVEAGGARKKFTFDAKGKSVTEMGWEAVEWEFTAAGDETEVEFYTAEDSDPDRGPALDDVSVKLKK